jgi:agmatinase
LGPRAITPEELEFMTNNNVYYSLPQKVDLKKIIKSTKKKIYLSIDIDVLDYYLAIGSGCPEYGGFTLTELIDYITEIIKNKEIIGLDLMETNPMLDGSRVTIYSSALLLRQIIIELVKNSKNSN